MALEGYSLSTIEQFVGRPLGVTEWVSIEQKRIDQFADSTDDHQWIHVDVERAVREGAFGTTVAHGYLTLALLARFTYEVGLVPADAGQAFNYGLDRVRFMTLVRAGARSRPRHLAGRGAERRRPGAHKGSAHDRDRWRGQARDGGRGARHAGRELKGEEP